MRIAFGCQARVGKDTACQYLQAAHGGTVLHFSDALYRVLHFTQRTCQFPERKDTSFLQWVGTWAREQDPAVWINALLQAVPSEGNVFVGDLRYRNEYRALKDAGFTCVRIIRAGRPIDRDPNHPSEIELVDHDWDYTIVNDGTEEEFYAKLNDLNQRLGTSND